MDRLAALPEIVARYGDQLQAHPWMPLLGASLAALGFGMGGALGRRPKTAGLVVLGLAAAGLYLAWGQLALVDDAFITFRYVDNWLGGRGVVWNPGERVLGITNFGWMVLLTGLCGSTGWPVEYAALGAGAAAYLLLLAVVASTERTLACGGPFVPLATGLLATQYTVTAFASTGLETELAAACVIAGALLWMREGERAALASGALFVVAGIIRLDHLLAYAVGGVLLLPRAYQRPREIVAYALTSVPLLLMLLWMRLYYGEIVPNTAHAKVSQGFYADQGLIYLAVYWLGSHLWVALPALVGWVGLARGQERWLALWALAFSAGWHLYLLKIGGDFMVGRFLLPVVPLVLLAAVRVLLLLHARRPRLAWAGVLVLGATLRGGPLVGFSALEWELADENTIYPVTKLVPLEIPHHHFRTGKLMRALLTDRGVTMPIATSGIGMVGYYSRLELIDLVGLTDRTVARQPVTRRGRPGHEKRAPPRYLDQRQVRLIRVKYADPLDEAMRRFDLPADWPGAKRHWFLWTYDEALMQRLAREVPEISFTPFRPWVKQQLLPALETMETKEARVWLAKLDQFYWSVNGPDELRQELLRRIEEKN